MEPNYHFVLKDHKLIILVFLFVVCIWEISYAFITSHYEDSLISEVSAITHTTDVLNFSIDKDINLTVNQFNFGSGAGNLSDTSVATAVLLANSATNNATYYYDVYLKIDTNDYIYTTAELIPEIILTITDAQGNAVTSIEGLEYVTQNAIQGFDITDKVGLFQIADNYEISSNSSKEEVIDNWNITVTFINLDTNQLDNAGGTLVAKTILNINN